MVSAALAAGRRAAERIMLSACRVTRLFEVTLDTSSLNLSDDDPSNDLVYEGPCRLREVSPRILNRYAEGQVLADQQLVLSLPVGTSGDVRTGDLVTITDGGPDPSLTGRQYRIGGLHSQTEATAHRYPVEIWT